MTTVDSYRSTQLELPSDVQTNGRRSHTTHDAVTSNNIPPAVPSPPRQSARHSPPRKYRVLPKQEHTIIMASENSSQWLFAESELAYTPSVLDGLPVVEERCRRAKGVNFILQAGILLKLPMVTIGTASVFFHRFYMRRSMVPEKEGIHHYNIAATSLFLATKTEENCRKTKEIVIAVAKVAQKNSSLIIDEQSKEYWRWRDSILLYEELMLELLTFDVVLSSPYNYLYNFLLKLQVEDNKPLRNAAWSFLNDSFLTTMCLLMSPRDITVAAIYFAARYTQSSIPDDRNGDPWWEQLGGKPELITKAVGVINELYSENPLKKSENPYGQSPASAGHEEDLDRTRGRNEPFSADTPNSQDRALSQASQNGHHERNGENRTPVINSDTSEHENHKQESPKLQAELQSPKGAAVSTTRTNGSSDAPLKEAANDPATHETSGYTNGLSELLNTSDELLKPSSKRKEVEATDESESKKIKISSSAESKQTSLPIATRDTEESEEGELEE